VTVTDDRGKTSRLAGGFTYTPTDDAFAVSPAVLRKAAAVSLTWSVSGTPEATLSGFGTVRASGHATAVVDATTGFALTAAGEGFAGPPRSARVTLLPAGQARLARPRITAPTPDLVVRDSSVEVAWPSVDGASWYDVRVFDASDGATVFSGSVSSGRAASSARVRLSRGRYILAVRACSGSVEDATCGDFEDRQFQTEPSRPIESPEISFPVSGRILDGSTHTFKWAPVAKTSGATLVYELLVEDVAAGTREVDVAVGETVTSLPVRLTRTGVYRVRVRGCEAACGPYSAPALVFARVPRSPTAAPLLVAAAMNGRVLNATWQPRSRAEYYEACAIDPHGGPGSIPWTVAARQTADSSAAMRLPAGRMVVAVRACTGAGCGPFSATLPVEALELDQEPQIGSPAAEGVVSGPQVDFAWSRSVGDRAGETSYRLLVRDRDRGRVAIDVRTPFNWHRALLRPGGARYEAQVTANRPGSTVSGPISRFEVYGASPPAPIFVQPPTHLAEGDVTLAWTPVPGAGLYEYSVATEGDGHVRSAGVTRDLEATVALAALGSAPTPYHAILRACPVAWTCAPGSDGGWGPWSDEVASGPAQFTIERRPRATESSRQRSARY
jgi:hypothetical protein